MKLANVSWGWNPTPEGLPKGDSLLRITEAIREIGFEGIDYLATEEALDAFFDERRSRELGERARSIGLEPKVLVFQAAKWNHPDPEVRARNLAYFEKCVRVARWIGCSIVSSLAPKPAGARPWRLDPKAAAQKEGFHLPSDYSYRADWERLVGEYRRALAIAKDHGLRMSIECFVFSMLGSPHAMLRALEDVGDPDFGIQLDTNHLVAQRVDPVWAICLLGGGRIFNVHCKDHDLVRGNIPAGSGITDYTAVIKALRDVGYDGNLTVELEFTDNPRRYNKQAYDHLRLCLAGQY